MYNKIAPIILNSGKANGLSDVYVAQPDALKETLAGKVFILAEIGGKKNDGRKIMNFLVQSLEENYYNDEKVMLRDKIEGLKIENIFEAAIAKTNKELTDFLIHEHIRLNTAMSNITVGVVFENKLYFAGYGKNRALLLYRRGEQFDVINVETDAAEVPASKKDDEMPSAPALFSSVISGEIPTGSYFVFASENLPEYVSNRDLVSIVTKLPPIVAAEQIKNVLGKINSFVPFLGIIIKNTIGLESQEREEIREQQSAHSSISSLNYTEQKTERMLAPAGLISLSKIYKGAKGLVKSIQPEAKPATKKIYKPEEEKNVQPSLELGQVRSLNNMARADSFMLNEKIVFKRKPNPFAGLFKKLGQGLPRLFSFRFWPDMFTNLRAWLIGLSGRNRLLFGLLAAAVVIFFLSLGITRWSGKVEAARNNYQNMVSTIEEKEAAISSYLLYNNETGARSLLAETQELLSALPKKSKSQAETYSRLEAKLGEQSDKILKIVKISQAQKAVDLSGFAAKNIVFAEGKIYAAGGETVTVLTPFSSSSSQMSLAGSDLSRPQYDAKGLLYYWSGGKLAEFNLKTGQSKLTPASAEGMTGFQVFNNKIYVLSASQNKIYSLASTKDGYTNKTDWLKETADLSRSSDLAIDGNIYILNTDGSILKFYKNKKADFQATALEPAMSSASKLIVGSKYIYLFDAAAKRLAVLAIKDGHLMNQYQVDSLASPQDFTIDEKGQAAYFLDSGGVYKIALNQ